MSIEKRITVFIEHKGLSVRSFCSRCGLSSTSTTSLKSPRYETLKAILQAFPELSPDWLLLGQGEMLRSNESTEKTPDVEVEETVCEVPQKRYTDNMSVQERLEIYIRSKGLGNYQFEMKVGLSQGYIKRVRNCLHPEKIKRIANVFPDLNIEWMIIGRGEMIVNTPNKLYENEIQKLLREQNNLQQDMINRLKMELSEAKAERIALDKEVKRLTKNLQDLAAMYSQQISSTLESIREKLTA